MTEGGEEEGMIEDFQARVGRNGVGCGLLLYKGGRFSVGSRMFHRTILSIDQQAIHIQNSWNWVRFGFSP